MICFYRAAACMRVLDREAKLGAAARDGHSHAVGALLQAWPYSDGAWVRALAMAASGGHVKTVKTMLGTRGGVYLRETG